MVSTAVRWISRPSSIEVIAVDELSTALESKRGRVSPVPSLDTVPSCESYNESQIEEGIVLQPRSVSFAEPIVTRSWEIPKVAPKLAKNLYYSGGDFVKFRKQHRTKYGDDGKYDRVFCEQLVEELDQVACDYYGRGELKEALQAFQHSLQIRRMTKIDFGTRSTSNTIHCVGDIYAKQREWKRAKDAYAAAQHALRTHANENNRDVQKSLMALKRKRSFVEKRLSIARMVGFK